MRDINAQWIEQTQSCLPHEMIYADDCDFITEMEKEKYTTYRNAKRILNNNNLQVNEDKTEHTIIKREKEEIWRNVIKLGSKLGDNEDIKRRK